MSTAADVLSSFVCRQRTGCRLRNVTSNSVRVYCWCPVGTTIGMVDQMEAGNRTFSNLFVQRFTAVQRKAKSTTLWYTIVFLTIPPGSQRHFEMGTLLLKRFEDETLRSVICLLMVVTFQVAIAALLLLMLLRILLSVA